MRRCTKPLLARCWANVHVVCDADPGLSGQWGGASCARGLPSKHYALISFDWMLGLRW